MSPNRTLRPVLGAGAILSVSALVILGWILLADDSGDGVPELSIFCFEGYTEPEWVEAFEREHRCRVRITYTGTIGEMLRRTREAPEAFHLLSMDSGRVDLYRSDDLLQAIDVDQLDNYAQLRPFFREHPFSRDEGGRVWHIPIVWGTQTLSVDRDSLDPAVLADHLASGGVTCSLDILTDPRLRGRTAFFDEAANVVAIAGLHVGVADPHAFTPAETERVRECISAWAANAATFTHGVDDEFSVLAGGEVQVLLGGNDALLQRRLHAAGLQDRFGQYPPSEGTYCWIDGWVVTRPTTGRIRDLAHAWIDMMIGADGQAALAREVGFGSVTRAGAAHLTPAVHARTPWYGQPIEDFPGRLVIMAPADDPRRRMALWRDVKAGSDGR